MQVTLCIPAHNEEQQIDAALAAATSIGEPVVEILVALSACSDGTGDRVAAHARRDSRITAIATPVGKNRAWNALVQRARCDLLVFLDADVVPAPGALVTVAARLADSADAVIVGGRDVPRPVPWRQIGRVLARLAALPINHDFVTGRLYGIRRSRLHERLLAAGRVGPSEPPRIPEGMVCEDSWLDWVTPARLRLRAEAARVFFDAGDLDDALMTLARRDVTSEQLAASESASTADQPAASTRGKLLRALLQRLFLSEPWHDKVEAVAGLGVRALLRFIYRGDLRRRRAEMRARVRAGEGGEVLAGVGRTRSKRPAASGR